MKHLIITIFLTFVFCPIFALTSADIQGTWESDSASIYIKGDSLFWDTMENGVVEGTAYTYNIINDSTIILHDTFNDEERNICLANDKSFIVITPIEYSTLKHTEKEFMYFKIDINQEIWRKDKIIP